MLYTIKNEFLTVKIDGLGGVIRSVVNNENIEYIWQRKDDWKKSDLNLFPFVGRVNNGFYKISNDGMKYPMEMHGFLQKIELEVKELKEDKIVFSLKENENTLRIYPFKFHLEIERFLVKNELVTKYRVKNLDEKVLSFGMGGHPGFIIPNRENEEFEDCYLVFENSISPNRILLSENELGMVTRERESFTLEKSSKLSLKRDLFTNDAIILKDMGSSVTIRNKTNNDIISLNFPDMSYLAIWQPMNSKSSLLSIEPWTSLPGEENIVTNISEREDYIHLSSGKTYINEWNIIFH
ncbi:hypothetical protein BH739_16370 [Enterococcus casseliflavus]|nr:hypothetical protein BH739_16370 [Enterococcus casseliflavus]